MSINILIIGAGKMGREHLRVFQSVPECEVVGVVSRGGESAKKLAGEFGVPFHGTCWQTVAEESGAHACIVAVSHELTEAISRQVIDSGRHVLAEKPVALTSKAIEELASLAMHRDVIALAAVNRRFYPHITQALDYIRLVGEIYHVQVVAPDSPEQRRIQNTHTSTVCDLWFRMNTIHAIDLLRFAGGEVDQILGFGKKQIRNDHTTISASIRFANGAIGTFVNPAGVNSPWELRIAGENCELIAKPLEQSQIRIGNAKPKNNTVVVSNQRGSFKLGLREQANAFIDAIQIGQSYWPCSDFSDHAKTMSLIEHLQVFGE